MKNAVPLLFETCERGVSSAVAPELLPDNQNAWGMNIDIRGGKPATRPNLRNRVTLPPGLIQGAEYFGAQGGMVVVSIAGRLYRVRINGSSFTVEEITLDFVNSALIKQVWMTQTVETLVIQDGQSNAILYNGSTAPRAVSGQVPRGRMMAYGNGRLWVAINANNVVAGDIRTEAAGSELKFTEATYLTGGGKLFFPRYITGMSFIPVTGQADYGALLVFGAGETHAIRADITSRDDWGKVPGFVTAILRSVGASSQWSIVSVNQDLYWRDSNGGIRSIRNALADESGPGSSPVSREVSRLTDYDSNPQLSLCSGVYFDNRLLMTSSPFLMQNGGVGFRNLISLDYAPLSTMDGKSQPAYNGQWNGLNFVKLVGGEFLGKNRAFALTTDDEGNNELWEFGADNGYGGRADLVRVCTDGTADVPVENPIKCFVEYPLRNFGQSRSRKRLERCDVWLSSVDGPVDLTVYWRADNSKKWLQWDEAATCAKTTDASTSTPHVWKNLLPQERPQFKTFTIPDSVNDNIKYANSVGFEFQIRLVWTGRCRIHRMMTYGTQLDDPDYADRAGFEETCVEENISGNEIGYVIPSGGCPSLLMYQNGIVIRRTQAFGLGGVSVATAYTFQACNSGDIDIHNFSIDFFTGCPGGFQFTTPPPTTIPAGNCVEFVITYDPVGSALCPAVKRNALVVINVGGPVTSFTVDDSAHPSIPNITVQPIDATVEPGGDTSFLVTAEGTNPLVYQWQVSGDGGSTWNDVTDDDNYSGATTDTLAITDTPEGFDGNLYRVRVRNEWGQVYSDEVGLTVGASFFQVPLTSLGDTRAFTNASDYCPFIGHDPISPPGPCGSYLFLNSHTPDELDGYYEVSGPGLGDTYAFIIFALAVKSVGVVVGPISGKLACAFELPSTQTVQPINATLAGACGGCDHTITISLYDESGALLNTLSGTDSLDNTTLSMTVGSLSAGKYLIVMEYLIDGTVGSGWGASFGTRINTVGLPPVYPITMVSPTIFDQTNVSECGSVC